MIVSPYFGSNTLATIFLIVLELIVFLFGSFLGTILLWVSIDLVRKRELKDGAFLGFLGLLCCAIVVYSGFILIELYTGR